MKKMNKTTEKKLQLLDLAKRYQQQVTDKKIKMALSTLIKKGEKDLKSLKIKEIETVLEMVNNDDVFSAEKQEVLKKTSKKEVEKSGVVKPDYPKIFTPTLKLDLLDGDLIAKKVKVSTFDDFKQLLESEGDFYILAHWSKEDIETFNYASDRRVPAELVENGFPNDFDILEFIFKPEYEQAMFFRSIITEATFTFLECDFTRKKEECLESEGLPFEVYSIEKEKPKTRKRAKK